MSEQLQETPPTTAGPRTALRLVTDRNFGPYFFGNALSASGTWFQNLAGALLIYRLTESPFLLGVYSFMLFVPTLLLAPWAGNVADRYDRKSVLLATQPLAAALSATLGVLAAVDVADEWTVIGIGLALGVVTAFAAPAAMALPQSLVAPRDLTAAVALNSMTYNIARALGPTLAAGVIALAGIPVAFFVNAGTYVLFCVALVRVRPRAQRRAPHARLRDSVRLLREQPRLLWLLLVVMAVGFCSDPINTEAPAFALELGHPDTWAGVIIGAFGTGAVAAAVLTAGHEGSPRRTVAMLTLFGGAMIGFSLAPSLWIGLPFLLAAGFGYLSANARATAQLQLEVDETHVGRIMALWSIAFIGLRPVASIVDGTIADLAGVRVAGVVLALPALAMAVLVARRVRLATLRR